MNNINHNAEEMMNQKGVIYIILSAILLYLYYRKRDIAIFVGFVVVVVGTLILGKGGDAREGFEIGGGGKKGGGGIDKECAKMGFKPPKIDKKDINGSLEKAMKNIEKVAETKWPFEKGDIEGKSTEDKTVEANWKVITNSTFMKDSERKIRDNTQAGKVNTDYNALMGLWGPAEELYKKFIIQKKTDEEKSAVVEKHKANLDKIITSGPIVIEFINKLKKSDEIKDADDGVKDILKYITCLVKQWISISEAIKKATADDEGGAGGEDDEKPKNKKKTKKKPVDEGEADGEDEKPKKKPKNKKKPADDDEGE